MGWAMAMGDGTLANAVTAKGEGGAKVNGNGQGQQQHAMATGNSDRKLVVFSIFRAYKLFNVNISHFCGRFHNIASP